MSVSGRLSLAAAFLRRDWAIARSYRLAFSLEAIDAIVYLGLFYYLSRVVHVRPNAIGHHGHSYFAFAGVGLTVMAVMQVGLTSFAVRLRNDQVTGTLEALMVAPLSGGLVLLGGAAYDLLRAAALGVVMLLAGIVVFGLHVDIGSGDAWLLILGLCASLLVFAGIGVTIAAVTMVVKQAGAVLAFFVTGVAAFAGVYFPVTALPEPLRSLADLSPIKWSIDVIRHALIGGDVPSWEPFALVAAALVAVPAGLFFFRLSLDRARRLGTLTQY